MHFVTKPSRAGLIVALFLFPASLPAQVITPALEEGDVVAGVGTVTRIDNLAVNGAGHWLVEADTDNADTNTDQVVVKNGALHLQEGQALAAPAGATLDSFDSINLNENDDSGWNFFLDGTSGTGDDSGIYFNADLTLQEGTISTAPEFTPGTPYIGFFDAKIDNNNSNQIFVVASIDDPVIPSTVDRALVILSIDGSGNLLSESVHAKEGDILPGQVDPVNDFGTGPHQSAFNDAGEILFFADIDTPSTANDGTFYLGNTLLAQEGFPSPVAGRNYEFLSSRGVGLANSGAYVYKANLDGDTTDDELIILNGAVFRREGDSLPAIAPFALTSFGTGSGPVEVDNAGNVLWYGDWDDPDTNVDTGLFLNDQLLVQEGVTMIDGVIVDTISSGQDAFQMSDNGLWAIFEATLEDGTNGAYLIGLMPPVPVELSQLEATPGDRVVEVRWFTSSQVDHDGFHVYRSTSVTGERRQLTDDMVRGRDWHVWTDTTVEGSATYFYWVGAVALSGEEVLYGPVRVDTPNWTIRVTGLFLAAPNPFVRSTELRFTVDRPGPVSLVIHDVTGRVVHRFEQEEREAGDHSVVWDGRDVRGRPLPGGVYFARFQANGISESRKVVFLGR